MYISINTNNIEIYTLKILILFYYFCLFIFLLIINSSLVTSTIITNLLILLNPYLPCYKLKLNTTFVSRDADIVCEAALMAVIVKFLWLVQVWVNFFQFFSSISYYQFIVSLGLGHQNLSSVRNGLSLSCSQLNLEHPRI